MNLTDSERERMAYLRGDLELAEAIWAGCDAGDEALAEARSDGYGEGHSDGHEEGRRDAIEQIVELLRERNCAPELIREVESLR